MPDRSLRRVPTLLVLALASAGMQPTAALAQDVGTKEHYLQNGTPVPPGQLDAVGNLATIVGVCTATLVTQSLVLTAAHCVCAGQVTPTGCTNNAMFTLTNVRPVDDPTTAVDESATLANVPIAGTVAVHPQYTVGGWLLNDYAVVRLSTPADTRVMDVRPIPVERPDNRPSAGDVLTLVGYGRTGTNCAGTSMGKRSVSLPASSVSPATIVFNNTNQYVCPGDSGGPALNAAGNIVGVSSSGDGATNSNYDPTFVAYPWIFGIGNRLQVAGSVQLLRVHEVGTGYGPPTDPLDAEVIVKLDTTGDQAFGLPLRPGNDEGAHRAMLDALRSAFTLDQKVTLEYDVTGPLNGRLVRVIATP